MKWLFSPIIGFILILWQLSHFLLPFLYYTFFFLAWRDATSQRWCTWMFEFKRTSHNNLSEAKTSSSKQFFFKRPVKPPLNQDALRAFLSIDSGQSADSEFELWIRSSRICLYLLGIAIILEFFSQPFTACLITCFLKILTIQFWRRREILAQVFPRQVYALVKQIFTICNIVH